MRYPGVIVGKNTTIGEFTTLGKPYRLVMGKRLKSRNKTRIGSNCQIGNYVIIGKGTTVSDNCILDNFSQTEQNVFLGDRTILIYGTQICNDARVGKDCVIGGFVCERAVLEDHVRTFGSIVHRHYAGNRWDETEEETSPRIMHHSVVSFGALVIGNITVGPRSYICAGAIVTKDVPPRHIVRNVNVRTHYTKWPGELRKSLIFRGK